MSALPLPDSVVLVQRSQPELLVQVIADQLEMALRRRLEQHRPRPLGLATGRTMEPLYAALVSRLRRWSAADLQRLRKSWFSFNLDEYVGLPARHPASFASYMQQHLGEALALSSAQMRLPDGMAPDPSREARSYANAVMAAGGIGLQLLGLGTNGHVGFNEPPSARDAACRCVDLSWMTRVQNADAFSGDPALVPSQAITLGLAEILAAEEIHLIVTGAAKADILCRAFAQGSDAGCPASWLRHHPRVHLWVDDAALGTVMATC